MVKRSKLTRKWIYRSSHLKEFLGKGVLKICSKFIGEHPCRSVISIKLQSNFIEMTFRQGCSSVNLLHIFRTPFPKNTCRWLHLFLRTRLNGCFWIYSEFLMLTFEKVVLNSILAVLSGLIYVFKISVSTIMTMPVERY